MSKPIRVEGIDFEIQIIFRSEHVELLRPHFERVGLPSNTVNEMIDAYIASGEKVTYERWVLEYGQTVLNPRMNAKLGRPLDHPTYNKMLLFALKDELSSNPILKQLKQFKSA